MPRLSPAVLAIGLALQAAPSRDASGQGTVTAYSQMIGLRGPTYVVYAECGSENRNGAPPSNSVTCGQGVWAGTLTGFGSTANGVLRSGITMTADFPTVPPDGYYARVHVDSRWYDVATVAGMAGSPAPTFLEFTARLTGSLSANVEVGPAGGNAGAHPRATLYTAQALGGLDAVQSWALNADYEGVVPCAIYKCTQSWLIDRVVTWRVPVRVGGTAEFGLALDLLSSMGIGDEYTPTDVPGRGTALSEFGNTLRFENYRVLGAGGQDLTATSTVSFANGTVFGAATTVPEPSTTMLLGVGTAALGGIVMRRRRRNA